MTEATARGAGPIVPTGTGRLSSGIPGLDAMIGGGFMPGDSTLVAGSPGTGKTTTGLHFLAAGAQAGEPGLLITFEYLPQQLYRDAQQRGWPLKRWEEEGLVRVVCTTPDVLLSELEPRRTLLDDIIHEMRAGRVVIDSMTHFERAELGDGRLRERLAGLMNRLRLLGVTTVVTHEMPQIVGPGVTVSHWGLEFLVDNVILLQYVELDGEMRTAINVMKFRGADHDRKWHPYRQTGHGIEIEGEFKGVENISGGTARRTLEERARRLV